MSMDSTTRKSIAQRVIERAEARGVPIDKDPAFVSLLDQWISGDIDVMQMRERYLDVLARQKSERRARRARQANAGTNAVDPMTEQNDE